MKRGPWDRKSRDERGELSERPPQVEQVVEELRSYMLGWISYFRLANTPGIFRSLNQWIRRRLRALQLRQWKGGGTAYRELRARGVTENLAWRAARYARWHVAAHHALHTALPGAYFSALGVPWLAAH